MRRPAQETCTRQANPTSDLRSLRQRAKAARLASEAARAQAVTVREAARARRDAHIIVSCSWCRRYLVADNWRSDAELSAVARWRSEVGQVSHGVCPACIEALAPAS